jgi:hypothetical protein
LIGSQVRTDFAKHLFEFIAVRCGNAPPTNVEEQMPLSLTAVSVARILSFFHSSQRMLYRWIDQPIGSPAVDFSRVLGETLRVNFRIIER